MNSKKKKDDDRLKGKIEKSIVQPYIEGVHGVDMDSKLQNYFNKDIKHDLTAQDRGALFIKNIKNEMENDKMVLEEVAEMQKKYFANDLEIM